jgi:hypothetical protein
MCFSYSRVCAGIYMPCNHPDVTAHSSYWTCPDRMGGQENNDSIRGILRV